MVNIPNGLDLKKLLEDFADANGWTKDSELLKDEFGKRKMFKKLSENAVILWLPVGITKDNVYKMIAQTSGYESTVIEMVEKTGMFEENDEFINSPDVISSEPTDKELNGNKLYKVTYTEESEIANPVSYELFSKRELGSELSSWIDGLNEIYISKEIDRKKQEMLAQSPNPARSGGEID